MYGFILWPRFRVWSYRTSLIKSQRWTSQFLKCIINFKFRPSTQYKITLISLVLQSKIFSITLTGFNVLMALTGSFSEKKYWNEKIYSKDSEPKIDNLKLYAISNNFLYLLLQLDLKIKLKSRKSEIEYQLKFQGIVRNSILKNFKRKIKSFMKKLSGQDSKMKNSKDKFKMPQQGKKQEYSQIN